MDEHIHFIEHKASEVFGIYFHNNFLIDSSVQLTYISFLPAIILPGEAYFTPNFINFMPYKNKSFNNNAVFWIYNHVRPLMHEMKAFDVYQGKFIPNSEARFLSILKIRNNRICIWTKIKKIINALQFRRGNFKYIWNDLDLQSRTFL